MNNMNQYFIVQEAGRYYLYGTTPLHNGTILKLGNDTSIQPLINVIPQKKFYLEIK